MSAEPDVLLHRMPRNGGKGRAVRAGIAAATGEYLIIQDADLEYDPNDYVPMLRALVDGRGTVVYGSRYLGKGRAANQSLRRVSRRPQPEPRRLGVHRHLPHATRSPPTSCSAAPTWRRCRSRRRGSNSIIEITARLLARGARIVEVPIRYMPRSRKEGKKIGLRDWFIGARTFWRGYRRADQGSVEDGSGREAGPGWANLCVRPSAVYDALRKTGSKNSGCASNFATFGYAARSIRSTYR